MGDRPKWMPKLPPSEWRFEPTLRYGCLCAQIAALEEEDAHMVAYLGEYNDENREWRQAKIAALRKELEV